ncbi:cupin domain-containing protein [Histidinibacterium aquaticum]|uniref:Cupin n=1 Tax=Histidinibacterium aquaticum TaxID=2613962 RepID=A0A5J5GJ51_9RHOB|nr:cupin domain-containing protein [Histidinibacterium aquaticum]KAA9008256.1 cupin [Histidinibacterium aquaticum]
MPDEIESLTAAPAGGVPNHPKWPALVVRSGAAPEDMGATFAANGWGGTWEWTVYDFHHYHPESHEVLGVSAGTATIALGGEDDRALEVTAGDVMILPAGFGHKRLAASEDFAVVGAYPPGQESPEIARADEGRVKEALGKIRAVPRPTCPLGRGIIEDRWTE